MVGLFAIAFAAHAEPEREWPTYGHDAGGMRHSPLRQITPANVATLAPAWTYHMRKSSGPQPARFLSSQATPLVVNGVMYLTTPYNQVVALDAATGHELWTYDTTAFGAPA